MNSENDVPRIAAILPCYRVRNQVLDVIARIGNEFSLILCIDDACPEDSGKYIEHSCTDPRVTVIYHEKNQGVGGALITGYRKALEMGAKIAVKIDGDGQMDPALAPQFLTPLLHGEADYTKGNRFFRIEDLHGMPAIRLFGNALLSLLTKLSTGYWRLMDPTNGYTAIHTAALREIDLNKVANDYFFESDMLFHLAMARAVVRDIPMKAVYGREPSSMKISRLVFSFLRRHLANLLRRAFYQYILRDFSLASLFILTGVPFLLFGVTFGAGVWIHGLFEGQVTAPGTVMVAAIPIITGMQLLLAALQYDMGSFPVHPLQKNSPDDSEM